MHLNPPRRGVHHLEHLSFGVNLKKKAQKFLAGAVIIVLIVIAVGYYSQGTATPKPVFEDCFETGDLSRQSGVYSGNCFVGYVSPPLPQYVPSVTTQAMLNGTYGMQAYTHDCYDDFSYVYKTLPSLHDLNASTFYFVFDVKRLTGGQPESDPFAFSFYWLAHFSVYNPILSATSPSPITPKLLFSLGYSRGSFVVCYGWTTPQVYPMYLLTTQYLGGFKANDWFNIIMGSHRGSSDGWYCLWVNDKLVWNSTQYYGHGLDNTEFWGAAQNPTVYLGIQTPDWGKTVYYDNERVYDVMPQLPCVPNFWLFLATLITIVLTWAVGENYAKQWILLVPAIPALIYGIYVVLFNVPCYTLWRWMIPIAIIAISYGIYKYRHHSSRR